MGRAESGGGGRFLLRRGAACDKARLDALLTAEDMQGQFPPDAFTVCEVDGVLAGAIRVETLDGRAWIRPIVVDDACQGSGIGSALVEAAVREYGELCAVARGPAAAFYERLGFGPIGWDEVPVVLWHECDTCPDVGECAPRPLRRDAEQPR